MNDYTKFLAMISTEFHRYLMENEEFAEKIPANALVIFKKHSSIEELNLAETVR